MSYIDVYFLVNVVVDWLTLRLTAWIRKEPVTTSRIVGASIIGSSYAVLCTFTEIAFLQSVLMKLLVATAMIVLTFSYRHIKPLLRQMAVYFFVSFTLGGIMFVVQTILFTNIGYVGQLAIALLMVVFMIRFVVIDHRQQKIKFDHLADVVIRIQNEEHRCRALIDTGNQLYEPISQFPVVIAERAHWQNVDLYAEQWIHRLRIIPFKGIQKGSQMMPALRIDCIEIMVNDERFVNHHAYVGFTTEPLATDRSYQAIVHPALVQG